jgi:hypothetical protein
MQNKKAINIAAPALFQVCGVQKVFMPFAKK